MSTGDVPRTKSCEHVWPRQRANRVGVARFRGVVRIALRRDARKRSPRARWRRDRGSVVDADAAEARELHRGMAQIETCDQAENVDLDALDPTQLDAEETPQRGFDAGAAVGQPGIGVGAEVLAHRVCRQRGLKLGHGAQYGGGEGVAVRPGPDAIVAGMAIAIGRDRRLDLWYERR